MLKSQLITLDSRQRTLVELLQKHMHLVEVCVTAKAQLSSQPPNHPCSTDMRPQPDHFTAPAFALTSHKAGGTHSCSQEKGSQRKGSHRTATRAGWLRAAPPSNAKDLTEERPPASTLTQGKMTSTAAHMPKKKAASFQSSTLQKGNTSQHINCQRKGNSALTRAEDNSRHLSQLIRRGVLLSGSTLQLLLKVR